MLTCSFPAFRLNQPMYFSSPIIVANARLASCNALCVLRAITECNALNQPNASCASVALNIHEWMPSGECNSMERFSERKKQNEFYWKIIYWKLKNSALVVFLTCFPFNIFRDEMGLKSFLWNLKDAWILWRKHNNRGCFFMIKWKYSIENLHST